MRQRKARSAEIGRHDPSDLSILNIAVESAKRAREPECWVMHRKTRIEWRACSMSRCASSLSVSSLKENIGESYTHSPVEKSFQSSCRPSALTVIGE